jgi:hypothetical protein
MTGRLSRMATGERYRAKNKKRNALRGSMNYHKRKAKKFEKQLEELEARE